MDKHVEPRDWSEACLQEAEACINHQYKLAEKLEALGYKRQARRAREMLATFVKCYFAMHHCHETMEQQSFAALAKAWLTFAVELDSRHAFLAVIDEPPKCHTAMSPEESFYESPMPSVR